MTGDYILSVASILISRLRNDEVTIVLSEVSWIRSMALFYLLAFIISLDEMCLMIAFLKLKLNKTPLRGYAYIQLTVRPSIMS